MLQICIVFKLLAVTIAAFLHENVIVRFGVPKVLVNDRRTHLHNELIEAMTGGGFPALSTAKQLFTTLILTG